MPRDEPKVQGKRSVVVDYAADSMNAIGIQLLRFVHVDAVLGEQLRYIIVIDLVEFSFRGERHEDDLKGNARKFIDSFAQLRHCEERQLIPGDIDGSHTASSEPHLSILRHQLDVTTFFLFTANAIQIVFLG